MKTTKDQFSDPKKNLPPNDDKTQQFVLFKLGGEDYAVNIQVVKEVTVTPRISKIPKTPAFINGVANVRGDLIAIVDLEERFGLKSALQLGTDTSSASNSYTIVIDADTYTIGFIVKEMPGTLVLRGSQIDSSADIIEKAKHKNKFITGLGKTGGGNIVILLDILKVLSKKEIQHVAASR